MLKRYILLAVATVFFALQMFTGSVTAATLDEATRTVALDSQGDTVVLSTVEVDKGKRLFNYACAQCHIGGETRTDPNVDLGLETLSRATPSRDSIEGLVDYMENPTTYDGEQSIAELHPSLLSADIFPKMRNLTEEDLEAIAGHILMQPNVLGEQWAGGKARI